jgi:hypothetical protein
MGVSESCTLKINAFLVSEKVSTVLNVEIKTGRRTLLQASASGSARDYERGEPDDWPARPKGYAERRRGSPHLARPVECFDLAGPPASAPVPTSLI